MRSPRAAPGTQHLQPQSSHKASRSQGHGATFSQNCWLRRTMEDMRTSMIQSETLCKNHNTDCHPHLSNSCRTVRAALSQGSGSVTAEAPPAPIPAGMALWKAERRAQDLPGQWVPSKHCLLGEEGQQALPNETPGNGR